MVNANAFQLLHLRDIQAYVNVLLFCLKRVGHLLTHHCMLICFCYLSIFVGATFFCICNFHIFTWVVICQAQLVIYFMLKYAMEILLSESSVVTTYYFSWSTSAVAIFLAILGLTVLPVNAIVGSYITNLFEDR